MPNNFYITTTLPYVNAKPHIGFALEIVQADVISHYRRIKGDNVFFNTGTDEHGLKIYKKALEEKKDPQAYCDEYAAKFDDLKKALNLSYDNFIRTTDKHHIEAAQEFWLRCQKNGDIYKKNYKVKYCVGCELEKIESELLGGKCELHPNLELESIDEENYFFRFSKYEDKLLKLYENKNFVLPEFRLNEIRKFAERGLEDFSVSRLKSKMPWGAPVPGDHDHVMYVWFDALINYISCLGWPENTKNFEQWWPGVQIAGKDNLRQQTAMWQAMLMSAGLPTSKQVLIHGFITSGGQKMSKSLGNVVDPIKYIQKYGTDAVRYYLLSGITPFEDGDFTKEKFEQKYTADLANGLGNLVSRITTLVEKNSLDISLTLGRNKQLVEDVDKKMAEYKFNEALSILWNKFSECDEEITKKEPWKINDKDELKLMLEPIVQKALNAADLLQPFLPETAEKIIKNLTQDKIKKSEILFPRLQDTSSSREF
ncbi:MAG: methionine--tRNA ligase [Candidatus Kuenenbacteria bacterium]